MSLYMQPSLMSGWNPYLSLEEGIGKEIGLEVKVLILPAGEQAVFCSQTAETAVLVLQGQGSWSAGETCGSFSRNDQFSESCFCLHVPAALKICIRAESDCKFYVQSAENPRFFPPVFYTSNMVKTVLAGSNGELEGTMEREIRTIFDYNNAPYSNMVLGEVINKPGRWSSYPPHHHPQPEVYFYQFDKPQGFGAGFANGEVYETGQDGLLIIRSSYHSQVAAPGYAMCYVWGIRHLDGDPWLNTRIDEEEHKWLLDAQNRRSFYD